MKSDITATTYVRIISLVSTISTYVRNFHKSTMYLVKPALLSMLYVLKIALVGFSIQIFKRGDDSIHKKIVNTICRHMSLCVHHMSEEISLIHSLIISN